MNPTVPSTVAGGLAIVWGRFATVAIVQTVVVAIVQTMVVAIHLRMLTDLRLHPTRCHLFRRIRVLGARDRIEVRRDNHAILSLVLTIYTTKITPGLDTGSGRYSRAAALLHAPFL